MNMGYILELRKHLGSQPLIMTGVCVIVRNEEGQILLQKRTDSLDWGTLGGSLELGESLEEAASRELYEEAGLSASSFTFKTLLSGQDMYYKYPHGDEVFNVIVVYEADGIEGVPTINDDEGLALAYFSLIEPIPNINPFSEKILIQSGYINKD
jgi:8-oxo-dGTP pyrophosphatase MutT (NUDIX family)